MTDSSAPGRRPPIELEIEVEGTPEEVWDAIATGPGISSWYVPHVVEECQNGTHTASFGPGPEMQISGRVAAWNPPQRVVFDGGDADEGLAFEWLVQAKDGGTCIVRLVNSGFLEGDEWQDYYDAMHEGWQIFLANLQLHCAHFRGQAGTPSLPMASWPGPRDDAWTRLTTDLEVSPTPQIGDRLDVTSQNAPALGGTVVAVTPHRISLLVDDPAPGTAFIAAEGRGDSVEVSIWSYLYGPDAQELSARNDPIWREWLGARS